MNLKEIKDLIKIIDASSLSEFQIENDDIKLTIKKEIIVRQVETAHRDSYITREAVVSSAPISVVKSEIDETMNNREEENLHIIKSPIVGIFYSAGSPEAPNFVKVGDKVAVGQVLCIVEAMKLMNEITSDVDGEVVEILGKNQDPVEYGQPLFKIRKG